MDCESPRSVALLAVHPKYANRLMDGSKTVEFRKVKFREKIGFVVVYASTPIRRIVGYFSVSEIVKGSPRELWSSYKDAAGITEDDFWAYYKDSENAVAILVKDATKLEEPLTLDSVKPNNVAPQSFEYLPGHEFDRLLGLATA